VRIDQARMVSLPHISRPEGSITPVEGGETVPFEIRRVYYLYDIVGGASRGGHAHKELQQLIVAAMGGFTVVLDDGERRREFPLRRSYEGLYVPPMMWREIRDFTSGGVCVVLASLPYDEADYFRDYDEFVAATRAPTPPR
jgi:WxcM-like, C-terminal